MACPYRQGTCFLGEPPKILMIGFNEKIKLLAVTSNGYATFLDPGMCGASTTSCWASDAIISSANITVSRLNFYLGPQKS